MCVVGGRGGHKQCHMSKFSLGGGGGFQAVYV